MFPFWGTGSAQSWMDRSLFNFWRKWSCPCAQHTAWTQPDTDVWRKLLLSRVPNCCVKKTAFTFIFPKLLCQENSLYFHVSQTVVSRKQHLLSCFPNCCVKKTAFTFMFPKLLCQENNFYFHVSQTVVLKRKLLLSYFPNCCVKKITFTFIFPKLLWPSIQSW